MIKSLIYSDKTLNCYILTGNTLNTILVKVGQTGIKENVGYIILADLCQIKIYSSFDHYAAFIF